MLEERSKKFPLCRDNMLSKGSLFEPLSTCTTTQTCTLPSRSISWQKDARNLSIPHLAMKCWLCDQIGHKKINCPQATCFFCGRLGHLKRVCLNFRLAKMYDQEKHRPSRPSTNTHTTAEKEHSAARIAHSHRFPLDDSSDVSVEDTPHQPPEAMNLLEPLIKFFENLKEDSSANQVPVRLDHLKEEDSSANQVPVRLDRLKEEDSLANQKLVRLDHLKENFSVNQMPIPRDPTLDQADIRRERKEETEEMRWLDVIPMTKIDVDPFDKRKTFLRCPSCHSLYFQRKAALTHAQCEHLDYSPKFNRFNIYSNYKCDICKTNLSCNLIKFSCLGNFCLKCLPNSVEAYEIERSDHIFEYILQLSCPLCHQSHELDPQVGMLMYVASGLPHVLRHHRS